MQEGGAWLKWEELSPRRHTLWWCGGVSKSKASVSRPLGCPMAHPRFGCRCICVLPVHGFMQCNALLGL